MSDLPREPIAERLADTAWQRSEVERLRRLAFDDEALAHKRRANADAMELELIESQAAANIIREVGLTVGRDANGVPWVKVDDPDVGSLGLSAEQASILRGHLASRQQTVAEFLGDVLMEYGLGRATGKEYPPPAMVDREAE